jgi:hypothetical protein
MADEPVEPQELKLKVLGVEYPFPSFDTLSYKEARRIKKETGLVMGQFFSALEEGDPDALFAVAVIAKLRENPRFDVEDFSELMLTDIEIVVPEEAVEPEVEPASPLAVSGNGSEPESVERPLSSVEKLSVS